MTLASHLVACPGTIGNCSKPSRNSDDLGQRRERAVVRKVVDHEREQSEKSHNDALGTGSRVHRASIRSSSSPTAGGFVDNTIPR